jgi:hypothetical protein
MGRNSTERKKRRIAREVDREFAGLKAEYSNHTIGIVIDSWIERGRPPTKMRFTLSNPTMDTLRRTANQLAFRYPDRVFSYGFDESNTPVIEARIKY